MALKDNSVMQLNPGTLLQGGKYRIIKSLGQGGFGITYLAEQTLMERKVCIKEFFMKEYCDRDEATSHVSLGTQNNALMMQKYQEKFLKEARMIARLDHPNIIRILDVLMENNTAYYVMDYIEGRSLNDIVKERGALPEGEAVGYIRQVGEGLAYVHERGINHLDIKPGNIMVRKSDNHPILIDFGMSKQYDESGDQTSSTPLGISEGYAPLEIYRMGGVSSFSPQTDIYELGATLYRLVTGEMPPTASDVMNEGLPEMPANISVATKTAIEKAMEPRKKDRPENMQSFLSMFRALTSSTYNDSVPVSTINPAVADESETVLIDSILGDDTIILDTLDPAFWIAQAKAYIDAYDRPSKYILTGTPRQEVNLFLKEQQILGTSEKKGPNGTYSVDSYADKDLYYNGDGILEFYIVTKPAVEADLLGKAVAALEKAKEVDSKGSKAKDIATMMEDIHSKAANEALSEYLSGNFAKAAELFKKATEYASNPLLGKVDSLNTYYTALVSNMAGNTDQAIEFYNKCLDTGFYQDGYAFSNLAECYRVTGNEEARKTTLEKGMIQFPNNNNILIGLINLYIEKQEDTGKLFELLHSAQAIDPKNASLFYVEGNVYKQLGDIENAAKLYEKSSEVDPNYVFGPLGLGALYYDRAIEIQNKASEELDDNKYFALVKELDETLEKAINPFEKAFAKTEDNELKGAVAEYLKNIYFRLRDKNPEYEALSKKYEGYR